MIIAVTNAIYLINLFSELRMHHSSEQECISLTLQHLGIPCLLTSATIMAGFLSLLTNPVPAVQSFGLFAALGAFYAFGVSMLLMPVLLPLLPVRNRRQTQPEEHFFNRAVVFYLEKIEFQLKWVILLAAVAFVALALFGIGRIRVDTNLIRDLPAASPLARATHFIDERLAGVYSLGLSVQRRHAGPLVTVETLKKVDGLSQFLENQPEITKVNSLALLIKKIHQAREGNLEGFKIPEEEATLQDYLQRMAESDHPDFWSFISRDFRYLRLEARMRAVGTRRGRAMEDRIWDYLRKNWGPEYEVRLTGNAVLLGQMSERLVTNQMHSLGHAFLVILVLIMIFFRSWKMALFAAIPNLIPIVGLYGLMGYLQIELSTPTAMISSVVLGLVVDASIQFLYRFRYEFEHRRHYLQALHHTYRNIGQAMVVTTMILVFGFATSVFASFRPTIYFGLLTSVTILFSLICTLVILPIALILLKTFGQQDVFGPSRKQTLTPANRSSIIAA
jgi:predicted RND superfamily exporter protein